MKHEFKVGELWRVKNPGDAGVDGLLGFIDKIDQSYVYIIMNNTFRDVWLASDFNSYFERATKTK